MKLMLIVWSGLIAFGIVYFAIVGLEHT